MDKGHSFLEVATALAASLRTHVEPRPATHVHGGCINETYRWESGQGPLFVKMAERAGAAMLESEAAGLKELANAHGVRVPRVLAIGTTENVAYLALEWLRLGTPGANSGRQLGEQLARQHRQSAAWFGWSRDNFIGSTPQLNGWIDDWPTFFRDRRLQYQLSLAAQKGHGMALQQRGALLLESIAEFFSSYEPMPSLLHGDLWGGNWGVDHEGAAVIFDPAVYYGDREADIAMTRLFQGFDSSFYAAYQSAWPLDVSAATRVELYNLYHVLNHLNLFGAGYLHQAVTMIDSLLAELGH